MYQLKKPVFLWGKPGIGKSDLVREFAAESNMRLIDLRLTTLESVDLRGLPWIDNERMQTVWMKPEFFPTADIPTVVFLDELTAAEPRIQASSYQLILDRCVGSHVLPPSAWVIGAGNGLEDGAISYGMGAALADRFLHVNMVANPQDWIAWALDHDVHASVVTFIRLKPECLDSSQGIGGSEQMITPSPRSWEYVSRILKQAKSKSVQSLAISGLVGEGVAVQFLHTMEEVGQIPPIDALLKMTPSKAASRIPGTLSALYGFTYSAVAYVEKRDQMEWLILALEAMTKMQDSHPRAEIQSLGMELLLEKASRRKLMDQLVRSTAYTSTYKRKATELSN
ncbi:MAG: AAA family ATPase [Candidatus Dormibacteria bacterium]